MERYNYEIVNPEEMEDDDSFSWKYCFRQVLVCSALCVFYFTFGMCFGAPTVFIPQMRRDVNSTFVIDDSMASWLTSMLVFASVPGSFLLPISAAYFGRKNLHIFVSVSFVIGNFIFYFSTKISHIIVFEILTGPVAAALTSICIMVLTEYTSPKYRGVILTFKSATVFWGIWVSNAIGTFYHWRNIASTILILSFYPLVVIFFWPESPYYLACKGRFDECIKSHKWLKGSGKEANEELKRLLATQNKPKMTIKSTFKTIFSKSFYKPSLLCLCVFLLYTFSGKFVCAAYSIDIIKKMTSSESAAYTGMLILDGVSVFSMYIGTALSHYVKRRTLFFSATSMGITSLFSLSLYTYLVGLGVFEEDKFVSICMLSIYSIGICCGPMILSTSLYGELLPLEYRSLCMCLVSFVEKSILSVVTKTTPLVIKICGLHMAFLGFGLSSTVCLILLYIYMPETKDKTLYEITDLIMGNDNERKEIKKLYIHKK